MTPSARLSELKIELPGVTAPVGSYVPGIRTGNLVLVSGQIPISDGKVTVAGKVGKDVTLEEAADAARQCALNALAQINAALGSLDKVKRILSLRGFVNCTDAFTNQPEVINGASDLLVEGFGEQGRHARAAVGSNALPRGVMTEVEGLVAVV